MPIFDVLEFNVRDDDAPVVAIESPSSWHAAVQLDPFRCMGESPSGQLYTEKALSRPGWKHVEVQIVGEGT